MAAAARGLALSAQLGSRQSLGAADALPDAPGDPLAALYQTQPRLIPNLAIDLVYLAVSPALSPENVIRARLDRVLRAARLGRLAAQQSAVRRAAADRPRRARASYNLVTTFGLINFALGMGVAIHAVAWWLTIDRRRLWTRFAFFNLASAALFFCHIGA